MSKHDLPSVEDLETNDSYVNFTFKDMANPDWRIFCSAKYPEPLENMPLEYLKAVSKGLRNGYKFGCMNGHIRSPKRQYFIYNPDDLYVLGFVDYGDYSLGQDGDNKYVVYSTSITNNKYDSYRLQHRMKMSENQETAIRTAKRHLLPISHKEVVQRSFIATLDKLEESKRELDGELRHAVEKIQGLGTRADRLNKSRLWLELCHKVDSEQHFLSAELKSEVVDIRRLMKDVEERDSLPASGYCVRVYKRLGEQNFDVVRIPDLHEMRGWSSDTIFDSNYGTKRYTKAECLPSEIMSKLAVLAICEVGDYVEEIGHRNMETLYYVYA